MGYPAIDYVIQAIEVGSHGCAGWPVRCAWDSSRVEPVVSCEGYDWSSVDRLEANSQGVFRDPDYNVRV